MRFHESQSEQGQSIVLIALALIALVGIVGLVVDGGRVYGARRESQNASDAAAFAGASILATRAGSGPSDDAKVRDAVRAYALNNGVAATSDITAWYTRFGVSGVSSQVGSGTIPGDANGVKVQTAITLRTFLVGVVTGGNLGKVQTEATAKIGVLTSTGGLRPVTVPDINYTYGQSVKLQGNVPGPGNFQYLNLNGINVEKCPASSGNAVQLAIWIDPDTHFTTDKLNVDDLTICGNTGESNSQDVRAQLHEWFDRYPAGQRYWLIPLYDAVSKQGANFKYHISRFAVFDLSGYEQGNGSNSSAGDSCGATSPGNKCIVGKFVRYATLGEIDEGKNCYTSKVDVCGTKLTE